MGGLHCTGWKRLRNVILAYYDDAMQTIVDRDGLDGHAPLRVCQQR